MRKNSLDFWRKQIDGIDKGMLKLVEKQTQIVKAVAAIKMANSLCVFDKKREEFMGNIKARCSKKKKAE